MERSRFRLTKKWLFDGIILGYEVGALFSYRQAKITGIEELSEVLTSLEKDPLTAIVRAERKPIKDISNLTRPGQTPSDKPKKAVPRNGLVRHWGECFNALPYHFILIDVDHFKPESVDPVAKPVEAIEQYISKFLPECFQGVSYHWQLSSSAGHSDNIGVLKAPCPHTARPQGHALGNPNANANSARRTGSMNKLVGYIDGNSYYPGIFYLKL